MSTIQYVLMIFYVHNGFIYSIEKNDRESFALLVCPRQVVTSDGKNYDPKFAKQSHTKLLANKNYSFKYSKRCQALRNFDTSFAIGRKYSLKNGFNFELELDDEKLEIKYLQEPELDFGNGKYNSWPAAGLKRFHPLGFNIGVNHPQEIKVLLIGKKDCFHLLSKLKSGGGSGPYPFPGFTKIYQSKLTMGTERFVELTDSEITNATSSEEICDVLLRKALAVRNKLVDFDICLIELVDEWKPWFTNQPTDLHDQIKVAFHGKGIRTQLFNRNSMSAVDGSETMFEHLSLGIYFKSGGNPWKLKTGWPNTSYIGVSFGFSVDKSQKLFGIAEIFDSYGQYLSIRSVAIKEINLDDKFKDKDLRLSTTQFNSLLAGLLADYKEANDNNFPANVVIHKTTDFNVSEAEVIKSLKDYPINFSLVYIQTDHFYHIITDDDKEPTRGLYWKKSHDEVLLYTSGPSAGKKYFLPNAPIPLYIKRVMSSVYTVDEIAEQVVALTKLNFNSTNTYSKEPVTLIHSRKIVDLLRAGLAPSNIPVDPRFYL